MDTGSLSDRAAYGFPEASEYLRLSYGRLRDWTSAEGLVTPASSAGLSFNNLLELHVLSSLRNQHGLSLQRIRRALDEVKKHLHSEHPLLIARFPTDGMDLFLEEATAVINLSRGSQLALRNVISLYLHRIEWDPAGLARRFFPFIAAARRDDPKHISLSPDISFGKPVLAGTGISTAVIAGRFAARDSIASLAEEYGVAHQIIEDAIRWEVPKVKAA